MGVDEHDDDRVVIRLRDVYHIAKRTEDKVDLLAYAVSEKLPDHENRLRSMEKRVWAIPSLSAIIAVISLLIALRPHGAPTVSNQSAPVVSTPPVVVSVPPLTTPTTSFVVTAVRPPAKAPATTTTAAPASTTPTTVPRTTPTLPPVVSVPKPVTTLVQQLESLTPLGSLVKEH